MSGETSIFGLRFGANVNLHPAQAELKEFLAKPRQGVRATHADDLAVYREHVRAVTEFERNASPFLKDRMYYSVLSHSSFFNPVLQSVVELYKYFLHELYSLDFRKPASFITAAEREMAGLNPKKQSDAEKLARLQDLVAIRKSTLRELERKKKDLVREMENILTYIHDNLIRIAGLCEKAIVLLVQLQAGGAEERRLIEDIKHHFKQQLRDGLQQGMVTRKDLDAAQKDVAVLSGEISAMLRDDVFALSSLYEAILLHAKGIMQRLEDLGKAAGSIKIGDIDEEREVFRAVERVLVSLVSDLTIKFKPAEQPMTKTPYQALFEEKREELLASFFEHVRKERRGRQDRRSSEDRRKSDDPDYSGTERRSGEDRRTGKGRRR